MKLLNLTPHQINLVTESGHLAIDPTGLARCQEVTISLGVLTVNGIEVPLTKKTFGEIVGLPERVPGVGYIVSAVVAQEAWAQGRTDVFCPGSPVRDSEGRIIGAECLCSC